MRRVGLTHSAGNEASRRIAEKLGFSFEGIQPAANPLPGGRVADRCCYARFDRTGLLHFDVHWVSNLEDKVDPSSEVGVPDRRFLIWRVDDGAGVVEMPHAGYRALGWLC